MLFLCNNKNLIKKKNNKKVTEIIVNDQNIGFGLGCLHIVMMMILITSQLQHTSSILKMTQIFNN